MRIIKKLLFPLIWFKSIPSNITNTLTSKLVKKTGADKPNKFKTWKLKQTLWIQFLIELPIYILILWILNLIFNPFGLEVTPW